MIKEMPEGFYAVIDGVWYGVWRSRAEAKAGLQVELRRASYRTGHFERYKGKWRNKHANEPGHGRVTCWQARDAAVNTEIHISTPPSKLARSIKAQ